jgi:hypothetical protein
MIGINERLGFVLVVSRKPYKNKSFGVGENIRFFPLFNKILQRGTSDYHYPIFPDRVLHPERFYIAIDKIHAESICCVNIGPEDPILDAIGVRFGHNDDKISLLFRIPWIALGKIPFTNRFNDFQVL